jgi:hypothetical protein
MFIRETTWPHLVPHNSAKIQAFMTIRKMQFAEFGVDKNTQKYEIGGSKLYIVRAVTSNIFEATDPSESGLLCSWSNDIFGDIDFCSSRTRNFNSAVKNAISW